MKVRFEESGIHCYDRVTGIHLLLDEFVVPNKLLNTAPSVVSVALTNICDLDCYFCYVPKSRDLLEEKAVLNWCRELDDLGTLEVALGGGEPTLYPQLADLCSQIWTETNLGISITTNGHNLKPSLISKLIGSVSIIRVSIDSPEPLYSRLRKRPLAPVIEGIRRLGGQIPVGINTVINETTLPTLDQTVQLVKDFGAIDWLLLPEVRNGEFVLGQNDWSRLEEWVNEHWSEVNLSITSEARRHIQCPFLFAREDLNDYAHISADYHLRECSYKPGGLPLHGRSISEGLRDLRMVEAPSQANERRNLS